MANAQAVPLDEVQFRGSFEQLQEAQGIHSNSVLFYFAYSPFFDSTSNNAVLFNQALYNPSMYHLVQTREAFEGRLKSMDGISYVVAQEPAEMAPGTGTGVWVIRKQKRLTPQRPDRMSDAEWAIARKEPEITVLGTYYIVGEFIYQAPTLADILTFRLSHIAYELGQCFPAADKVRMWSPSAGHSYKLPPTNPGMPRARAPGSSEATPLPETQGSRNASDSKKSSKAGPDSALAEQSFAIHMQFGGEYMDENPITGKPGEFHLSSTGRKERLQIPGMKSLTTAFKPPEAPDLGKKDAESDKTPKTPTGMPSKSKRKKPKAAATPTSS